MKLSELFIEPVDEHLHIVVKHPNSEKETVEEERMSVFCVKVRAFSSFSFLDKHHSSGFQNVISCISKAVAPADSAKSSMYTKSHSIYNSRYEADKPRTSDSLPVQLFHPAFRHFLNNMIFPNPTISSTKLRST